MALETGAVVGAYQIETVLGQGGMGVVYRALDSRLNRTVAIKFLSNDLADAAARRRFQREAQTASSLSHPHIIAVHDVGEFDGRQYLVTELAAGGTLSDWAIGGTRSWRDVVELLVGVADALATAHEAGILHRDIKPGNVLLTKSGYAKLADFGLAKVQESDDALTRAGITGTLPGVIVGTVAYMSPEQASGAMVNFRSDIFSFGIVLYELLSGRLPFPGTSSVDVMHAILHSTPGPLPDTVPVPLRLLVEKTLEKNPADRYQTMRDLVVDLRRLLRQSGDDTTTKVPVVARARKWPWAIAGAALIAAVAAGMAYFPRSSPPGAFKVTYAQLTNFSDSVVSPTISPDGRMLAFIRGENTFSGPGDIYVKLLPDGEPAQLTHDKSEKMGPLFFTADSSSINYSYGNTWSWSVPVLGGNPTRLLANAGALSWFKTANGERRVMYSAMTGEGIHMGVYTAEPTRANERKIYLPADVNGMAHRSALSPDGKSVLLAEMDLTGWRPCRLVPFDGSSAGVQVGPVPSQCTDVAWTPDGQWMYLSANSGNGFHIWRQRFPDGAPEQVTSGATEEQGIAFDPDGRSFVTSMGDRQSTLWLHAGTTRQITFEGFAYTPTFSPDRKTVYFLQRSHQDRRFVSGELWAMNVASDRRERLLPDSLMESYDVASDDEHVAFVRVDETGRSSIWEASLDGSFSPRQLSALQSIRVRYGPNDDLFFVAAGESSTLYVYRIPKGGGEPQKVFPTPVAFLYDVSPDGKWVAAWVGTAVGFYPIAGGTPVILCPGCGTAGDENRGVTPPLVHWSRDGKYLYIYAKRTEQTYVLPLHAREMVPNLPSEGYPNLDVAAKALGAHAIEDLRPFVSDDPSMYVFPRVSAHRNIYRVSIP